MSGRLTVELHGLDAELGRFRGMNAEIDRVVRSGISQATRSAATAIRKGVAQELGATEGAIKKKNRITYRIKRDHGLVWIGLEPLLPTHLGGNVTQTSSGVTAGNRSFVGAFHKAIYTQDKKVWIRLRSRHYDADLYPYKGRRDSGSIDSALRHRFPVVLGRVKVDIAAIRDLINHEADRCGELMADIVAQELGIAIGSKS
jgi:hypothetical protein